MDKMDIISKLHRFSKYAEEQLGLYVYSVALKGSQNYNLDDEESDVDANLVFIPTLDQIRTGKSFKIEMPFGECTCHNIYKFAEIVAKGNPQWIEVCHTKYKIGDDLKMFQHYKVNPSALKGMVMEKVNAIDKLYPSRTHMIEKFGYDPKQLHHIIRLYDLLKNDVPIYTYSEHEREKMIAIKRGSLSKDKAQLCMNATLVQLGLIYDEKKIKYKLQDIDYEAIDNIVYNFYRYNI